MNHTRVFRAKRYLTVKLNFWPSQNENDDDEATTTTRLQYRTLRSFFAGIQATTIPSATECP